MNTKVQLITWVVLSVKWRSTGWKGDVPNFCKSLS